MPTLAPPFWEMVARQILQRLPVQRHLDRQTAVLGVGSDVHLIVDDLVVDLVGVGGAGRQGQQTGRQQQTQQRPANGLFHGQHPSLFPSPSWQICSSLALLARMARQASPSRWWASRR